MYHWAQRLVAFPLMGLLLELEVTDLGGQRHLEEPYGGALLNWWCWDGCYEFAGYYN